MEININQTKWWKRIATSIARFTSLPLKLQFKDSKEYAIRAMEFWPLVGWVTGGIAALAIILLRPLVGMGIAVGLAIALRCLITGLRNEHALAALSTAIISGKRDKEALRIMEDYSFGAVGAAAIAIYWAILWWALVRMDASSAALTILAADSYSRMVAGQSIQMMPCATRDEDFGSTPSYLHLTTFTGIIYFLVGILPLVALLYLCSTCVRWELILFIPCLVMYFLYLLIWKRYGGYTDVTIAAMALLIELAFCLVITL